MSKPKPMIHVHNHGPEQGKGVACPEQLVGECQILATLERLNKTLERLNKLEAMIGKIALILREDMTSE